MGKICGVGGLLAGVPHQLLASMPQPYSGSCPQTGVGVDVVCGGMYMGFNRRFADAFLGVHLGDDNEWASCW